MSKLVSLIGWDVNSHIQKSPEVDQDDIVLVRGLMM